MKISKTLFFAAAASLLAGTFFAPEAGAAVSIDKYLYTSSSLEGDEVSMSDFFDKTAARDITLYSDSDGGMVVIDSNAYVYNKTDNAAYQNNSYKDAVDVFYYTRLNTTRFPGNSYASTGQGAYVIWYDSNLEKTEDSGTGFDGGEIVIKDGKVLTVFGQINTWVDYGSSNGETYENALGETVTFSTHMDGATTVTLEGNAVLDFSSYIYNSIQIGVNIQHIHNLYSTTAGGQLLTRDYSSGDASNYFVNIYIDDTLENGGTIGNISGSANIIKTGTGNFTLLGNNTTYGIGDNKSVANTPKMANVFLSGGSLTLSSGEYYGTTTLYDPNETLKKFFEDKECGFCQENGLEYHFGVSVVGANSLNLAGTTGSTTTKSNEGSILATAYDSMTTKGTYVDGAGTAHNYISDMGTLIEKPSATILFVKTNQVVRNLQAMFANGASATDTKKSITSAISNAASSSSFPIVTGTGRGSVIALESDAILAIYQESGHGGIYKGSIAGISQDDEGNDVADLTVKGGTILKYGSGDLALMLQTANFQDIAVVEGLLVVNVATLNGAVAEEGVYVYGKNKATLSIVENQAVTLQKVLTVEKDANVEFARYKYINTLGGQVDVSSGNRAAGTIEIGRQQEIYGNVIVRSGIELKPTADYALANAQSIILLGDSSNSENTDEVSSWAVLSFGGTNQTINNLIGDKWARVETGTSALITLNIDELDVDEGGEILSGAYKNDSGDLDLTSLNSGIYGTFYGEFTGWGNIVKTGAGTLALSGNSSLFGAVIVAEGDLEGTASTFTNASALILDKETSATFVGNQFFSAIYGAEGSVLDLGKNRLTIGESVSRQNELMNVESLPATVFLANSDRKVFAEARDISTAMKPIFDLLDSESSTYAALESFASGDMLTDANLTLMKDLFGNPNLTLLTDLTEADIATAYLKLLKENEIISGDDDFVENLTFKGDVTAGSIYKQDGSKQSLLGKVTTSSITVAAGTLEVAGDSLTAFDVAEGEKKSPITVTINEDAEFIITATGTTSEDAVEISGKGALVINSDVDLDLNKQFVNDTTGTITLEGTNDEKAVDFTMTLRNPIATLAAQGDITVEGNANLILDQSLDDPSEQYCDVSWGNSLNVSGDLVKIGKYALTLTSDDSHVGGNVVVKQGSLSLIDWDDDGTTAIGGIDIAAGTSLTLSMAGGIDSNFEGKIVSAGTLVKTGDGALTISATDGSDFAGTFEVLGGSVTIAAADTFASTLTLDVREGTSTTLAGSQTIAELKGAGMVTLGVDSDSSVNLTLALDNAKSAITVDNMTLVNGTRYYVADVPTTEKFVGNFTGTLLSAVDSDAQLTINGNGAYAFDSTATIDENIAITVKTGQLVVSAEQGDRAIVVNSETRTVEVSTWKVEKNVAELVYNVVEGGKGLLGDNLEQTYNIGKIGLGTLELSASQVSKKNLTIYQGVLEIDTSTNPFSFDNAIVAKDATLVINYWGSDGSNIDLTKVEGSGTLKFVNQGSILPITLNEEMVLPTTPTAAQNGRYFNGLIEFEKMSITVDDDTTLPAVSLDENSELNVIDGATLSFVLSTDSQIACETTIDSGAQISITSQGTGDFNKLAFTDSVKGTIVVNNGAVQIDYDEDLKSGQNQGKIVVNGSADLYFNVDADKPPVSKMTEATIDVSNATGTLRLIKTGEGTMALIFGDLGEDESAVIATFKSSGTTTLAARSSTTSLKAYTIGVNEGTLTLQNIERAGEHISLTTLDAGTLVLQGTQTLDRTITGDGKVEKTGNGTLKITANQTFTGTLTLSAGTTIVEDNASFMTKQLIVSAGATLTGGVTLKNADATSALMLDAGATINLSAGDVISYAGTLDANAIAGTIKLTGTLTQGQEKVVFQSTGTQEAFDRTAQDQIASKITYSSSNFMLSQNSAGTLSVYAINSDLSSLSLHEGLDGFANALGSVLDDALPTGTKNYVLEVDLAKTNPIAVTMFKSSAAELSNIVKGASPLMYSAMTTMLWSSHDNDISQLRDRATARRFEMVNEFANHGWQAWANARVTLVENGSGNDSPVYDYNMIGVLAGADKKVDDYTMMGVALGYDFGKADVHNSGGRIESNDLRFTVYGSTLLGDGSWFVDYGATASVSDFDIKHRSIFGTATDDANGFSLGAYGVLGRGFLLMVDKEERVVLTPYVGLSAYYSMIDSINETGGNANLDIDKIKALSLRGMLGASLDWAFLLGEYEARLSLDAAYSHEFGDDEIDIDASIRGYSFSCDAAGTSKDTFSIGPAFSLGIGPKTMVRLAYRANFGTNEEISHNVNLGIRHNF